MDVNVENTTAQIWKNVKLILLKNDTQSKNTWNELKSSRVQTSASMNSH